MELFCYLLIWGVVSVIIAGVKLGRMAECFCYLIICGVLTVIVVGVELDGQVENPSSMASIEKASPEELALYNLIIGRYTPARRQQIEQYVAFDPVQEGALLRAINNTKSERWTRDWRRVDNFVRHPSPALKAAGAYMKEHGVNSPFKLADQSVSLLSHTISSFTSGYQENPLQDWALLVANILSIAFIVRLLTATVKKDDVWGR